MLQLHTQLGLSRSGSDCKNLCENYQRIFNKPTSRLAALTSGAPVPAQRHIGPMRSTSPSAIADDKTAVPHWGCRSGPLPSVHSLGMLHCPRSCLRIFVRFVRVMARTTRCGRVSPHRVQRCDYWPQRAWLPCGCLHDAAVGQIRFMSDTLHRLSSATANRAGL